MDERVRFVARLLEGEKMAALCREFAISRKTGYKIFDRYKESGLEALTDRSHRPWRHGNQLPRQVEITRATASSGFSIAAVRWLVGFLKRPIAPAKGSMSLAVHWQPKRYRSTAPCSRQTPSS
jgi:hypothetical protein